MRRSTGDTEMFKIRAVHLLPCRELGTCTISARKLFLNSDLLEFELELEFRKCKKLSSVYISSPTLDFRINVRNNTN